MDRQWWVGRQHGPFRGYRKEVLERFSGERYTTTHGVEGVVTLEKRDMEHYGNSGASAVSLAAHFGAAKIILIGYDCRKTPAAHWHGDHVKGLGNAGTVRQWPQKFERLAAKLKDIEIVNCTPGTALKCFKTGRLSDQL